MLDDVSGTEIFYQTEEDEFHHIHDNVDALDELLVELRGTFIMAGYAPWSSVTLMLDGSGRFSLEYGYEDVSDFERAGERREKWLAKRLGGNAEIITHE